MCNYSVTSSFSLLYSKFGHGSNGEGMKNEQHDTPMKQSTPSNNSGFLQIKLSINKVHVIHYIERVKYHA